MAVGRIVISDVDPVVSCGRYPAKAVRGERVAVVATVFREGHDAVAADVVVSRPDGTRLPFLRMTPGWNDRWSADFVADAEGDWAFAVEGWSDPLGTWWHDAPLKVDAGVDAAGEGRLPCPRQWRHRSHSRSRCGDRGSD